MRDPIYMSVFNKSFMLWSLQHVLTWEYFYPKTTSCELTTGLCMPSVNTCTYIQPSPMPITRTTKSVRIALQPKSPCRQQNVGEVLNHSLQVVCTHLSSWLGVKTSTLRIQTSCVYPHLCNVCTGMCSLASHICALCIAMDKYIHVSQ